MHPLPLPFWGSHLSLVSPSIPWLLTFPLLPLPRFLPVYSTLVTHIPPFLDGPHSQVSTHILHPKLRHLLLLYAIAPSSPWATVCPGAVIATALVGLPMFTSYCCSLSSHPPKRSLNVYDDFPQYFPSLSYVPCQGGCIRPPWHQDGHHAGQFLLPHPQTPLNGSA